MNFRTTLPALALLMGLAPITTIHAATYVVTRLDDPVSDGSGCQPGDCSLREAVDASALSDPFGPTDRIELPTGDISLIRGPLSLPLQGLEIVGSGKESTRITTTTELFVTLAGSARQLTLRDLSMQTTDPATYNVLSSSNGGGEFRLFDIKVPAGGGSVSFNGDDTFDVEVRDSEIATTLRCSGLVGTCYIVDSRLRGFVLQPSADSEMTALLLRVEVDGLMDPDNPSFSSSIGNVEEATIEDSRITNSKLVINNARPVVSLYGLLYDNNIGPIETQAAATVTLTDSELRDNHSRAIRAGDGAEWLIERSSFINNRADDEAGDDAGGAILVENATQLRIRNSTFSGNSFSVAAANAARGGAVGWRNADGALILLRHATVIAPSIFPAGIEGTAVGGFGDAHLSIQNSIIRGSCVFGVSAFGELGNVESPGDSCHFQSGLPGDSLVNVSMPELALSTLGDHGGAAPTFLPQPGSVAIDSGHPDSCLANDQRAAARPVGSGCDVGAVEAGADPGDAILFTDGFE
ncbi:right-handed parallel beta-helix repeat-containing protein [Dokdonella sp.]|uniref:right-handed parallel beta-helix repeat-containing protein n=1 Tax=Dokdonella sp. TaxID=2291710 RepID=UPI0025C38EFE|nr:right-handed parallel beta-helix repeat-containing protein [Dokdonella sp.]MBX3690439.1 right-handed parallel beta-helix repeat-containing protein [Dokdonella sp.]